MYVPLELIKSHLCIDQAFTGDDEYILYLYEVAEAVVQVYLCANLEDFEDENHNIPAAIKHAILLYIGEMYNNREVNAYGVSVTPTTFNFEFIIGLYKNYADTSSSAFYKKVLDSVISRLSIDRTTGNLMLEEIEYIPGIKGKAIKRIEDELLMDAGRLYLEQN